MWRGVARFFEGDPVQVTGRIPAECLSLLADQIGSLEQCIVISFVHLPDGDDPPARDPPNVAPSPNMHANPL